MGDERACSASGHFDQFQTIKTKLSIGHSATTDLRSKFSLQNKIADLLIALNIFVIYNLFQDMFV